MSNVHHLKVDRQLSHRPACPACASHMGLDYIEHLNVRSSKQFYTCKACWSEAVIKVSEKPEMLT